jgi:hypothetical protein
MPDEAPKPNRLVIFTNLPDESLNPDPEIWTLSDMLVMKFKPGMNDLMNPKRYALRFWRPAPPKQPELL